MIWRGFVLYFVLINLATAAAYAWDKRAAIQGQRRVRERTLLMLGLAGGWPMGLAVQQSLRHKNRKASFQMWFWLTVALHASLMGLLLWALFRHG